jgi:serine/threonine protein kinase/tetratricopeptide (TPR) repeat protein
MDTSLLSVQDRAQYEELLDQFDRALKECRGGKLPDVDAFLGDAVGQSRDYLRREMESLWHDLVRGEYIKLRRIGGGGMGEVFLARHIKLGRQFALKEIKLECLQHSDRAEFEKRFKREVEACGRLEHHPNLVSVTNTGTSQHGVPYLVMEFVDGQDLKQIVERIGPLEIADACRIVHDAAAGLSHAHEKGLIHRDIKPSNIMVSKHGMVTVLDLGLARIIEGERQATYVSTPGLVGSFDYMSPEQCREDFQIDARADVYSLGCTLYFLLAGRPPFADEKSIFQKLNAHQQHPLPAIDRLREHAPLWQLVERMAAKEPADRFADLRSVMLSLRPYAGGSNLASLVAADYQSLTRTRDDSGSTLPYADLATPRRSGSQTVVGDTARDPRRVSRRRFLTAASAAAAAGVAGGLTYYYGRPKPFTGPAALMLGTLPGLNGRWWFEETPWLLPEVRLNLARSLADDEDATFALAAAGNSADVAAFHGDLRRQIDSARGRWPRDVNDRLSKLQNLDPETLGDDGLEEALAQMVESLETRRLTSGLSAVQWHELGNLQHQRNEADSAVLAYEEAAGRYDAEGNRPLLALCLADWGHLRMRQRRFVLAQEKFHSARDAAAKIAGAGNAWTRWFVLDSLCNEGDAHRGFGNWEPALACLRQAAEIVADSAAPGLDGLHPLRAVFHERCGWYHLDVWRLAAARADFGHAKAIREANDRAGNPFALHFSYWNRQGNAMVDFYDNRIADARDALREMLKTPGGEVRRKQYDQLKSRYPNLHERLADIGLVNRDLDVNALEELQRAISTGESEGFRDDGRWGHLVRLMFKSAVVAALSSGLDPAKKRLETAQGELEKLQKYQPAGATRAASGKRPQVFATAHDLATACVDWLQADPAVKERGRRALLAQLGRSPIEIPRDDLLLLLYVGEHMSRDRSLAEADRQIVAGAMTALTGIGPKAAAVDARDSKPVGSPALFAEYRKRAGGG